jgi:amino acid adenylation domain-containing protein
MITASRSTDTKKNIETIYPLSPMQQGMLFHSLLAPEAGLYMPQICLTLSGQLEVAAFQQAWQQEIEQNQPLRTAFYWEQRDTPFQIVFRQVTAAWTVLDWRDLDQPEQQLQAWLAADRQVPFDLKRPPLLRLTLIHYGDRRYWFVLTQHHLILDGWSAALLLQRVFSRCLQPQLALAPPPAYGQYITWLRQQSQEAAAEFWQHYLAGATEIQALQLATQPQGRPPKFETLARQLSAPQTQALKAVAQSQGVTLNTLVQAAFALTLQRFSQSPEVVFGVTSSGRPSQLPQVGQMIGLFINTLPLRVICDPALPLPQWLQDLQQNQNQLLQYEYSALSDIQRWGGGPEALFEALLVFENYPVEVGALSSQSVLTIERVESIEWTNLPLTLLVSEKAAVLNFELKLDRARFDAADIAHYLEYFQFYLTQLGLHLGSNLGDLPLLTPEDEAQLVQWNQTAAAYPELTIHQQFEQQVARTPEAIALKFQNQTLTYAGLNAQANQLAQLLQPQIQPGQPVGICLGRSLELVVALLGVSKAGGVYVPIEPDYPLERQQVIIAQTQMQLLIAGDLPGQVPGEFPREFPREFPGEFNPPVQVINLKAFPPDLTTAPNPQVSVPLDSPLYILYTSGSTGLPKGVVVSHRSISNRLHWMQERYRLTPSDRVLQKTPFSFDVSVWEFFWPLLQGATLVIAEPEGHRDVSYLDRLIQTESVSVLHFVPSMLRAFLDLPQLPKSIRLLFASGEALPQDLVNAVAAKSQAQLHNLYGPTEAAIDVTYYPTLEGTGLAQASTVPIGQPIANTQIHILNAQQQPVPIGVAGELYIGGVGLAQGYWQQPGVTAQSFVETPWGRLYRSGDRARWGRNGLLSYLGRLDRQVKLNGLRIELGEIEACLLQCSLVKQAAVILHQGEAASALVAYVLGDFADSAAMAQQLTQFLGDRLPSYMVPSQWMALAAFPVTANGKLDWRALPLPGQVSPVQDRPVATVTENMIAEIWGNVLKRQQTSASENLFEIGGNSLVATRINARLQEAFQQEFPLQKVFNYPTIAQFAEYIERNFGAGADAQVDLDADLDASSNPGGLNQRGPWQIPPRDRTQPLPLSFAQQRLWFLEQLQPGTGSYNIPVAVRIQGQLDVAALSQALTQLVQRQEGLRLQFINQAGQPQMGVRSPQPFALPLIDLSAQLHIQRAADPADEADEADPATQIIHQAMRQEVTQAFDLAQDWLMRGKLLQAEDQDYVLLLTLHHIVTDGWSMDILVQELAALYRGLVLDRPAALPDLPIQYADFAAWQRQHLQGAVLERQLAYWQSRLAAPRTILQLPTDQPRSRVQAFVGEVQQFQLSPELTQGLKALAQQGDATLFVLLLAAYKVLLARYTGQHDIIVGCPIANRRQVELEPIIGLFVNTLVLRDQVEPSATFREFLAQVKRNAYEAYDHQDLPFEYLVEQLQPERDLSYNPLFQVKFRLENAPTESIELPGISLSKLPQVGFSSKLDLSLDLYDTGSQLVGSFEYNQALFQPETMARFQQHFVNCLEAIVANPDQPIAAVQILSRPEQQTLLEDWNQTARPYPAADLFIQQFEAQVAEYPDHLALLYQPRDTAPETLTYAELNRRSNQLARHLQALGVTAESLVGICLERSPAMIIALLAVFKAGGAYVPLDAAYPQERLRFMLEDAQVGVLLTQSNLRSSLPTGEELREGAVVEIDRFTYADYPDDNFPCPATINNLAYLIYTSGSTGRPKGVLVEHAGLLNLTLDKIRVCHVEPGDRVLQFFSFSFDASIPEIVMSLGAGAALCLAAPESLLPGPGLLQLLRSQAITHITITPSALAQTPYDDLPALKMVLVGGEAPSPELIQQWSQNRLFINAYGPTETTVNASMVACGNGQPLLPTIRPSTNKQLYILDASQQPLPIGVIGELYIGGVGLARGYHNRPEVTAAKFHANPWRQGERIYQTGDLAYHLPDGRVRLVGRVDDQVKIRGFRIELAEIETLLHQHPTVEAAAVIVREMTILAYSLCPTVSPGDYGETSRTLRRFLRQQLPEYMVPAAVMVLPQFPLTPNGKIDFKALPDIQYQTDRAAQPQNSTQAELLLIYQKILQIESIGINDDFFELGGHSLLATQLVAQVLQVFGIELTVMDLFNAPTVTGLSEQILCYQLQAPGDLARSLAGDLAGDDSGASEREEFEL